MHDSELGFKSRGIAELKGWGYLDGLDGVATLLVVALHLPVELHLHLGAKFE